MDQQQRSLRMYALALASVPDPDAAGDLVMEADSEADLLMRANRLRRAQGLAALAEAPPELPALDETQAEYALHLGRRAALRRRARRTLVLGWAAVGVVALVGGAYHLGQGFLLAMGWTVPLLGLLMVGAGMVLVVRRKDGPSWLMLAWGGVYLANPLISRLLYARPVTSANMEQIYRLSAAMSAVQMALLWGTAAYAAWRLWPRRVNA